MSVLQDKIKYLPENPGVYVMLDDKGQIIYVGKAKNLKNRVRQYFHASVKTEKVMAMVKNIADFYYIIAPSEIDALSLENNLKTIRHIRISGLILKSLIRLLRLREKLKRTGQNILGRLWVA